MSARVARFSETTRLLTQCGSESSNPQTEPPHVSARVLQLSKPARLRDAAPCRGKRKTKPTHVGK